METILLILKNQKNSVRENYELYKLNNLDEKDKSLETQNLSTLNHKEIENLFSISITMAYN